MKPDIRSEAWKVRGRIHVLKLTVIRPKPILYRVEHRIVGTPDRPGEMHRTLFYNRKQADDFYTELRTQPPQTYER